MHETTFHGCACDTEAGIAVDACAILMGIANLGSTAHQAICLQQQLSTTAYNFGVWVVYNANGSLCVCMSAHTKSLLVAFSTATAKKWHQQL